MKKIALVLVAALAACGGDDGAGSTSGVDSSKAITTLSTTEVSTFCSWAIDVQGGAGHMTMCPDNVTITTKTEAQCQTQYSQLPTGCSSVTVGQVEACVNAIGANACTGFSSSACSAFVACSTGM